MSCPHDTDVTLMRLFSCNIGGAGRRVCSGTMAGSGLRDFDHDDDDKPRGGPQGKRLKDWDCPSCNAHNPTEELVDKRGAEIRCNYCGVEFRVTVTDEGRFKFKEI